LYLITCAIEILLIHFIILQVATRLLCSSSPVLYWFAALLTTSSETELVPVEIPKEEKPLAELQIALKVETAKNLDTRHSTILLQVSITHFSLGFQHKSFDVLGLVSR
jgi:hypothetical protein